MSHHFIRFQSVGYTYATGVQALSNLSFYIAHGQKVALIGSNGAGKSTLLKLLVGLVMPFQGTVSVGDIPLVTSTLPRIRQTVGLVFQHVEDQLFMPTLAEDVAFGPRNMQLPEAEVQLRVERSLRLLGIWELRQRAPYTLSGGQMKLAALATILAMEPSILLLDEPTGGLDPRGRRRVMAQLASFTHTCLIATHDLDLALRLCPRTLLLCEGRLVADAATRDVLSDGALMEAYGL